MNILEAFEKMKEGKCVKNNHELVYRMKITNWTSPSSTEQPEWRIFFKSSDGRWIEHDKFHQSEIMSLEWEVVEEGED